MPLVLTLPCQRHCIHAPCPNTPMPATSKGQCQPLDSENISSGTNSTHTHKQTTAKSTQIQFCTCHSSQDWPMPLLNWQAFVYWQNNLMSEGRFHHFLLQKGPHILAQITGTMVSYIPKGRPHYCRVTSVLSSGVVVPLLVPCAQDTAF